MDWIAHKHKVSRISKDQLAPVDVTLCLVLRRQW